MYFMNYFFIKVYYSNYIPNVIINFIAKEYLYGFKIIMLFNYLKVHLNNFIINFKYYFVNCYFID